MTAKEANWYRTEFGYFQNSGLNGQLLGYVCKGPIRFEKRYWLLPAVGIYDFKLNEHHPLTLVCGKRFEQIGFPQGTELQPSKRYESDKGSIPSFAHIFYERDRFLGFYPHDSCYEFSYIWAKFPDTDAWVRHYVSRWEADKMLEYSVGADPLPGNAVDRAAIFNAVHVGGFFVWNPKEKAARRKDRKQESVAKTPFPPPDTHSSVA